MDDLIGKNLKRDASWRASPVAISRRATLADRTLSAAGSLDFHGAPRIGICESQSRDDNARDHIVQ